MHLRSLKSQSFILNLSSTLTSIGVFSISAKDVIILVCPTSCPRLSVSRNSEFSFAMFGEFS